MPDLHVLVTGGAGYIGTHTLVAMLAAGQRPLVVDDFSNGSREAVRRALVAQGIDPRRIVTRGLGPALPVASNNTSGGRQQNRRVEITISDEAGSIPPRA